MTSYRLDPYLWLHLAGLAAVPLWLFLAWLGIAAGTPIIPTRLEIILLVSLSIVPILWMQWTRPFSPYGLLLFTLQPSQLSLEQRKILQRLRGQRTRILASLGIVPMIWVIGQLYTLAPLAQSATPIPNHFLGFGVAAIALLAAHLFWQVPLSILGLFLTRQTQWDSTDPYPVADIRSTFTSPGLPVQTLLPPLRGVASPSPTPQPPPSTTEPPKTSPPEPDPDPSPVADHTPADLDPAPLVQAPDTPADLDTPGPVMEVLPVEVLPEDEPPSATELPPSA